MKRSGNETCWRCPRRTGPWPANPSLFCLHARRTLGRAARWAHRQLSHDPRAGLLDRLATGPDRQLRDGAAMMVALYLRVSTIDQDPETQGREVRAFASARGWEVVETYVDVGVSGARARRPELDRLIHDAWRGRFVAVVVWDLSRMARSTLHALELLRELEQMKVRLIAVKQTFDTDTPLGKAFFTLAAMFAELERSILIERVRAGMARARAEGKCIGRPERAVNLEELGRLRGQGLSIRQVARRLGVPSSTVAKRLKLLATAMPLEPAASEAHHGA